jgi:Tol biopolymer transport system component/DNA-binding winged helix-turn-helix (wHTH) protein
MAVAISSLDPIISFGVFELNTQTGELRKWGRIVRLRPQAVRVLAALATRPGELVTREELRVEIWGKETFVDFGHGLNLCIQQIRAVIDDNAEIPRYIETVPRRGYRFICPVVTEQSTARGLSAALVAPAKREAPALASSDSFPELVSKEFVVGKKRRHWTIAGACVFLAVVVAVAIWYLRRPLPAPRFTDYVQLTNDGRGKSVRGTDGSNLFLNLYAPGGIAIVPVSGGQLTQLPIDLPTKKNFPNEDPVLGPVSPDGASLLIQSHWDIINGFDLWVVGALGRPARFLVKAITETWSPDGKTVLYATPHGDLYTVPVEGGESRLVLASPAPAGQILYTTGLRWSPDGARIRFVRKGRYWEASANGTGLHEVFPGWNPSTPMCCGRWTPDGDFFLFGAGAELSNGLIYLGAPIWVQDERRQRLGAPILEPVQMTTGPTRWSDIVMSNDGKKVFSRGITSRGELVIQERKSSELLPYLGGISVEQVSFSRDGKYLVYVTFPEGVMWRANRDGSGLMQLTRSPFHPLNPKWSPDASKILFNDLSPTGVMAIYTVSSQGGAPARSLPDDKDIEADPTWSPDGKKIVFNRSTGDMPSLRSEPPATCVLDLTTGMIKTLPPSPKFFRSPRWSPNGRFIIGLTLRVPMDDLEMYDLETGKWSLLHLHQGRISNPSWSHDSRFIYYLVASNYEQEIIGEPGVYRIPVTGGKPEKVVGLTGFRHTGWHSQWMGLDPDDRPLLLRDEGTDEIYALTLERK